MITYYVYDANRNKIAQQDANDDLVTYKYDALKLGSRTPTSSSRPAL